jgi:pimeloyl-ACP methyl ester carboxylesterase
MPGSGSRATLQVREYGTSATTAVLLHGGPGAPGYLAPLARALAGSFRVLEPLQRRSGGGPLTVATHVADLHEVVRSHCGGKRAALVGHSWGAMLALAYAAEHPGRAASLVLIGCGTFDVSARERLEAVREERMDRSLQQAIDRLPEEVPDPDERLKWLGNLILPLYSYDLITRELELEACDERGYQETWNDMLSLQERGIYPASFTSIEAPVIMLHGAHDPHPGGLIRASLEPYIPHLEYREWEQCGHYPWLERAVREEFLTALREWLSSQPT